MTDREAMKMALDAMLSEYSTGGENKYSPWDVIEALRQALAKPEQPMSPEHLPKYIATNGVKPMEGGGGGGSQPECDWTTDTPVPPFKYFDFPEYKIAQPEQEPVCDKDPYYCGYVRCQLGKVCKNTAPPKREWVGLTDEERVQAFVGAGLELAYLDYDVDMKISKVIESRLKEKNT